MNHQETKIKLFERWEEIEPLFKELENRNVNSSEELMRWLEDYNDLLETLQESQAWTFINMTRDTTNKDYEQKYIYFVKEITPKATKYEHTLWKKYYESPYRKDISFEGKEIFDKRVKNSLEIFNEKNIPLKSKESLLAKKYNQIQGSMLVNIDGEELTIQQAYALLKNKDRSFREKVWHKITEVQQSKADELDELFNEQIKIRNEIAKNAGFDNYVEYRYKELGRFDYTPEQVKGLREIIKEKVTPVYQRLLEFRKRKLQVDQLRPWDMQVDLISDKPLKPFETGQELLEKTIEILTSIHSEWGKMIEILDKNNLLDLESRKGKAPGGYQYPLEKTKLPFIFMNSVGTHNDLVTMLHESGHAVHTFYSNHIKFALNREVTPELAEVASMSMEFITTSAWNLVYTDKTELTNALFKQYIRPITLLVWIATVDEFQHWIYENPNHSIQERREKFAELYKKYMGETLDWSYYEDRLQIAWHKQLHIFEIPFYYIEYGISQIGALQTWRNVLQNKEEGIKSFENYLSLGYTRSIPETYEAGNIKFWFSGSDVEALFELLTNKIKELVIEF